MKVLPLIFKLIWLFLTNGNLVVEMFLVDDARGEPVRVVSTARWGYDAPLIILLEDR